MGGVVARTLMWRGHVVVELRGELDVMVAADTQAAIGMAAALGCVVTVNMSDLAYLDCAGLGALLHARAAAWQAGGDVLLAAPRPLVRRLLSLTGADSELCVYESVAAAHRAATSPGRESVTAIAYRWGFTSPGRFAAYSPALPALVCCREHPNCGLPALSAVRPTREHE